MAGVTQFEVNEVALYKPEKSDSKFEVKIIQVLSNPPTWAKNKNTTWYKIKSTKPGIETAAPQDQLTKLSGGKRKSKKNRLNKRKTRKHKGFSIKHYHSM